MVMSSSFHLGSCSLVLVTLARLAGIAGLASCGPSSAPPPDALGEAVPTSPAGRFALTSTFDVPVPPIAAPVIEALTAATDGPDDPSRYLVDRMIATLPDGTVKTIAAEAAPYVAAYLNARLAAVAPRFAPGIDAIAGGLDRVATHLGTTETLEIDASGAAIRTITGVRFELGSAVTSVRLADAGLGDLAVATHVALDATGRLAIGDHAHALPYGALLRIGLERAVIPGVEPTAHDLAGALAALLDCDQLGAVVAGRVGLGTAALYGTACRTAMTVIASQIDARLAAIAETPIVLEVTGAATGVDHDGDGTMDELRTGRWSGSLHAAGDGDPISAASFSGVTAP
jgi:hypothetical protein